MRNLKPLCISAAVALALAGTAQAQTTTRTDTAKPADTRTETRADHKVDRKAKKADEDRIEADAKAAKAKCGNMKGNEKDICQAEAKATEKVAKKELDYKNKPTDKNKYEWDKMKAEAAYEVAKEKCEDQKGSDIVTCKRNAKDEEKRAIAALKADKKVAKKS